MEEVILLLLEQTEEFGLGGKRKGINGRNRNFGSEEMKKKTENGTPKTRKIKKLN